ncbi:DEAD/DEAH box helicase family protein [Patescibacteria group bacterium]|nr:DEAD/DEAH box helicase family protein [Patescibacteria group bacterium]
MNESETRAEYIDPKLKQAGWGEVEGSKILREYRITDGRIQTGGVRAKPEIADYILVFNHRKLAVIEAKQVELMATEGLAQAQTYAEKLHLEYAYATNGKEIYEFDMKTGKGQNVESFPTPWQLWNQVYSDQNEWKEKFTSVPFEKLFGESEPRYYQEIAVNKALNAIAEDKTRILLTLATGTGKTNIAFHIAWKLFHTRWNLQRDGGRRPRILFMADRNILANQAFNAFNEFPEDALVRISPADIRKKGNVPTNGSIFFTIFQTFMSGPNNTPYYGDYPPDFFDFIVIDECHRGGANNESNWRGILEYFSPAVQLGLTATPKRKDNIDTYRYFGDPVYIYSLKQGINDGFLTPFRVRIVKTTLDEYLYTTDDEVVEGEVEEGKIYVEDDFAKGRIEIIEREEERVKIMLKEIDQTDKTLVFCSTQGHALLIRDLINKNKESKDPFYCVRVTANDGARGDQYLADFKDNEKTIPTILTTSQKLSTGVDARNVRNIVLMRPVNSVVEFKQIVGRGTRLFDGKEYFTIIDFVDAYKHFSDQEWDGEPIAKIIDDEKKAEKYDNEKKKFKPMVVRDSDDLEEADEIEEKPKKIKIKLSDGKVREVQHIISTLFYSASGKPISGEEFLKNIYGDLPEFIKNEDDLRKIWSDPKTRKAFLEKIEKAGYGKEELENLKKLVDAEDSDLFDVLAYVAFATPMFTRKERVDEAEPFIVKGLDEKQKEFLDFVLSKYIEVGEQELSEEKLPELLKLKYKAITDAEEKLGGVKKIRVTFFELQKALYSKLDPR